MFKCCEKSIYIKKHISYFTWEYLLKQKVVVEKSLEWKFMVIIARNAKFLPDLCQKWQKTDNIQ